MTEFMFVFLKYQYSNCMYISGYVGATKFNAESKQFFKAEHSLRLFFWYVIWNINFKITDKLL
jgi:hypothetical protein